MSLLVALLYITAKWLVGWEVLQRILVSLWRKEERVHKCWRIIRYYIYSDTLIFFN